jgi:hypothetical protein
MYAVDVPAFLNIKSRQARFRRLNKSCVVFVPFEIRKAPAAWIKKQQLKFERPNDTF